MYLTNNWPQMSQFHNSDITVPNVHDTKDIEFCVTLKNTGPYSKLPICQLSSINLTIDLLTDASYSLQIRYNLLAK